MQTDVEFCWCVEKACWSAWPVATQREIDGWLCRSSGGTTRRANSVNATPRAGAVRDVIPGADAYFEKRGGSPALFRLLSFQPAFAHALSARGYRPEGATHTLLADLVEMEAQTSSASRPSVGLVSGPVSGSVSGLQLEPAPSPAWLADKQELSSQSEAEAEIFRAMLADITHPACFARKVADNRGRSLAYGVYVAPFLVIEAVVTREEDRNKGFAGELVAALMAWGRAEGAQHACLQVMAENEPAIALYRRLGFGVTLYDYQYWRKP